MCHNRAFKLKAGMIAAYAYHLIINKTVINLLLSLQCRKTGYHRFRILCAKHIASGYKYIGSGFNQTASCLQIHTSVYLYLGMRS